MTFYQITCDDKIIYDIRSKNRLVISPTLNLEDRKNGSLSFTIPKSNPEYKSIHLMKSIIKVYQITKKNGIFESERIFRGVAYDSTKDIFNRKTIDCEGHFTFFNDSVVRKYSYSGSVEEYVKMLINSHNSQVDNFKQFTLRRCTVEDSNNYITRANENYPKTKEEMNNKLLSLLDGHFESEEIDGVEYIDYLKDYEKYNTQEIRFKKNILDINEHISAEGIATRIIGLGKKDDETGEYIKFDNNGKDYVESQSAINIFGIKTDTVVFDDVTIPANLLRKTQKYLETRIDSTTTIELSATDLHAIDVNIDALRIGRWTKVISEPHGLNRYFLLSKMTLNLDNPESSSIILGNVEKSFTESQVASENKTKNEEINILQRAINHATEMLTKFNSGYVIRHNGELFIADNEDLNQAVNLWRWNLNGFAHSSNGINGPYKTAITMDGQIVANFITAGILSGLQITNGNGFSVDPQGNMTSTSGKIGGFDIASTSLSTSGSKKYSYTMEDVTKCLNSITGLYTLTDEEIIKYDQNQDGKIDIVDTVQMLNIINGSKEAPTFSGHFKINNNSLSKFIEIYSDDGTLKTTIGLGVGTFTRLSTSQLFSEDIFANTVKFVDLEVTGTFSNSSDREKKENMKELEDKYMELLELIKPYIFNFKNDEQKKEHIGFIAQDVEKAFNDLNIIASPVIKKENSIEKRNDYFLEYNQFLGIMWKILQIQNEKIKKLEEGER